MTTRGDVPEAPFSELVSLAPLTRTRSAPVAGPWTARLWDGVLRFLPVLLMAVLAAVTWWLVKNTPVAGDGPAAAPPRHEPDYTMRDFAISNYGPDGALRARVEGEVLHHFPDSDTVEIDGVRLRAVDAGGRVTLGSAQHALSNGDATQIRLTGDARVVREPLPGDPESKLEVAGEFLELFTESDRIRSHLPVTVTTGHGAMRAGSLDYNHVDRTGTMGGRVSGELQAAPADRAR